MKWNERKEPLNPLHNRFQVVWSQWLKNLALSESVKWKEKSLFSVQSLLWLFIATWAACNVLSEIRSIKTCAWPPMMTSIALLISRLPGKTHTFFGTDTNLYSPHFTHSCNQRSTHSFIPITPHTLHPVSTPSPSSKHRRTQSIRCPFSISFSILFFSSSPLLFCDCHGQSACKDWGSFPSVWVVS